MKRIYGLLLLIFVFIFNTTTFGQWKPDAKPDFRKLHYLSEEEMLSPVRTQVDFVETPPPPGPIRMVAEFEPMQGVLIRYPFGIPYQLIREMASYIPVITIVSSTTQANQVLTLYQNNNINTANCTFLIAPSDSYWTRDYGPWFIFDGNNQPAICDFPYNRPRPNDNNIPPKVAQHLGIGLYGMNVSHTGGNIMADGLGISASTELVYEENSQTTAQIAQKFNDYLGVNRYDVIEDPLGDYIKHIDCWGKYLAPDKILIGQVPSTDQRYADYEAVANYFATTPSSYGYPYKVYRVNTPGGSQITPYTNSLILNNKVFVPTTGNALDNAAISVYQQAMPGYEIIGIQSSNWVNTDALHCRTHEIADLGMLFVDHRPKFGTVDWQDSINISAKILPYSGQSTIADSLKINYSINGQAYQSAALVNSLGYNYSGYIKNFSSHDTISYYISAADASGRSVKHPYMGALDPHEFILGEQGMTNITITPDTLYFDYELFGSFTIKNHTANEVVISEINKELWNTNFPTLPTLPYTLATGDSLVVDVQIYPGVFNSNPESIIYVEDLVSIVTNLSTKNISLMINSDILSDLNEMHDNNLQVYPNPFISEVTFNFNSQLKDAVDLSIFDLQGKLIFEQSIDNNLKPSQQINWNGQLNNGEKSQRGIYFYKLRIGNQILNGKIIRN